MDLDGGNRTTIVPSGATYTPKQLHFDAVDSKLYWGDREGMRVMRCDLDGSNIETLVQAGYGDEDRRDETRWCVGVAVDHVGGHLYWTQKGPSDAGLGRILRAGIDLPAGESAAHRGDIEFVFKDLPEPIDLEIEPTVATRRTATPSTALDWTASVLPNPSACRPTSWKASGSRWIRPTTACS